MFFYWQSIQFFMGARYKYSVTSHLLRSISIHPRGLFEKPWINNSNVKLQRKISASETSMLLLRLSWYNSSLRQNALIDNVIVNHDGLRFPEFLNKQSVGQFWTILLHRFCNNLALAQQDHYESCTTNRRAEQVQNRYSIRIRFTRDEKVTLINLSRCYTPKNFTLLSRSCEIM